MPRFADKKSVMIGSLRVTFLADGGGIVNPVATFPASDAEGWNRHRHFLDDDGKFITSIGGFLVETGDRKVIVDLGMGPVTVDFPGFGPFSGGRFLESLEAAGVEPEAVTDVLFTHLHLDHVGWTLNEEGALRFPNARYGVTVEEKKFWFGGDNPAGPHPKIQQALDDRLEPLEDGQEPVPGIKVIATPGHTPGHVCYAVSQGDQRILLLGDVIHSAVQLDEPSWCIAFDADPQVGIRSREAMLAELEEPGTVGAALHFSDAVFGQLVHAGGRRRWVAL